MSAGSSLPQELIAAYNASVSIHLFNTALLLYEASVTFDMEVKHIWRRKTSAATWIFLLNRYLAIALYIVDAPSTFQVSDEVRHTFASLRAYALCSRAWYIALVIFLLSAVPVWIYIHMTVIGRSCLMLSDLLVLSVTWSQTYGIMRLSREHHLDAPFPLTTVLLRDGQ
ncbi:hypothetical protein OH77DRAFT_1491881 [Trametes cingulata]|nr:hypothetical protein OH77DRAFT_1491881 [Trametes cingulata]